MLTNHCSERLFQVFEKCLENENAMIKYDTLWILVNLSAVLKAQTLEKHVSAKILRRIFSVLGSSNSSEFPLICLSCWIVGNISSIAPELRRIFINNGVIEEPIEKLSRHFKIYIFYTHQKMKKFYVHLVSIIRYRK